jgi:hypothetical protein
LPGLTIAKESKLKTCRAGSLIERKERAQNNFGDLWQCWQFWQLRKGLSNA